jgi:hypothetical protein
MIHAFQRGSPSVIKITISFRGEIADRNEIDFYDVSQALVGFQRSLALTTHLILNDEIITQAPSLKGAEIIALPPEEGSWKFAALIVGGIFAAGSVSKDSVIGHLIASGYDYVIKETLGFHVDFNKSLLKQYEEMKNEELKKLSQQRFDSLIEKCEPAIRQMHRPIVESKTAAAAELTSSIHGSDRKIGPDFNESTFDYVNYSALSDDEFDLAGNVSSYNINTYKGRMFVISEGRPIPFLLGDSARNRGSVGAIIRSLQANAESRLQNDSAGEVRFKAFKVSSRGGRLKSYLITRIY